MLEFLREFLKTERLDALLVNSTNEFLVEYNALSENARYHLTGFSGSTGDALVTPKKVFLFVDGRYHIQADCEVNHDITTVIKLQNGETFNSKLSEILAPGSKLGLNASKNSQDRVEQLEKIYRVKLLDDDLLPKSPESNCENTETVPEHLCGKTKEEKLSSLRKYLSDDDAILITNLEDVSYYFNSRDFSTPYSSKITKRAIITKQNAELYARNEFRKYKAKPKQNKNAEA